MPDLKHAYFFSFCLGMKKMHMKDSLKEILLRMVVRRVSVGTEVFRRVLSLEGEVLQKALRMCSVSELQTHPNLHNPGAADADQTHPNL